MPTNTEFKESSFGKIPIEWEEILVEDLVNNKVLAKPIDGNHGNIHPTASDFVKEGIPFIMANNVQDGILDLINCSCIKKEQADKLQKGFSKPGDVLLTHKGTVGNSAIVGNIETDYIMLSPQVTYYRIKNENILNKYYLKYFFESEIFQSILKVRSGGGTRAYIGITNQRQLPILLPNINEQKAMAHILDLLDKAINANNQLIAQKELRKKWLMQNLLTGKKRLKGFNADWKENHLGQFFTERNETKYIELPLLSVGANGIYPQSDSIKKDTSNEDKSKYRRICPGDIGYNTMRMWQGRSALSGLEGIVSPAYTIVTPKKNADSLFFSYLFKTPKLTNLFWRNSQGLVDDTLNCKFKDFAIVRVKLPTINEQIAIAKLLLTIDKELQLLKIKTEQLREQKKGMMQVLLTGKKRLI
jgi:type I restriction enzyme, S subunit